MQHTVGHFDALFSASTDPWEFKSRWYEIRKRALTLACLPQLRYASGYEPGCANGELSAALATRCDHLRVSDGSPLAVSMATTRLAGFANVTVTQAWVPEEWPVETFDLIVFSEFGFYMNGQELDALADKIVQSLRPGGTVLACHWRRPIDGCEFTGDKVHQRIFKRMSQSLELASLGHHLDSDMVLDIWSSDARSVAQREGFA